SYQWSVNNQVVSGATGPTPTLNLTDGANTVSLIVTDNTGTQSTPTSVSISVQAANAGPKVTIAGGNRTIPDGDDQPGELVPFEGSATDANGTVAVATFRWTVNDTPIDAANGVAKPVLPLDQGTNVVTLSATDNQGAAGSATVSV